VNGSINVTEDEQEQVVVELASLPDAGMHMLQVQAENGLFSNDFIFHVTESAEAADELHRRLAEADVDFRDALANAIAEGDLGEVKKWLGRRARRINDRRPSSGSTPLSDAAFRGNLEIVKLLLDRGANVNATNRDGNTPLIGAAFMCRTEVVRLLLDKGASPLKKNNREATVIEILSRPWNEELAGFYTGIGNATGVKVDLERLERERPLIAKRLRDHAKKSDQANDKRKDTGK
jgi:ankyrin repeat protein